MFTLTAISDQASAIDGLEFQWSSDGTNVDRTEKSVIYANSSQGRAFAVAVRSKYFRVKYTNGAINQTIFRLSTIYHYHGTGLISRPFKQSVDESNFAQLVNSGLLGKNADGSYDPIFLGRNLPESSLPVVIAESLTYSAAVNNFLSAASATDIFNIIGSASKTIRIHRIRISGSTTSGSPIKVGMKLIKRSALNTGGTRIASTMVPHDSTSPAATANVGHYTANPTALGSSVGNIRSMHVAFNQAGITGGEPIFDFKNQPIILRNATEQLCINFNSTTISGALISIYVEWSEV
jgi:hypothetical protein